MWLNKSNLRGNFQARSGRWRDCEAALQRLRGENAIISEEAAEIKVVLTSSIHGLSLFSLVQL